MGRITKDDRCLIKNIEKMGERLTKEFPSNTTLLNKKYSIEVVVTTTSLEYFLLSIAVSFVVADGPLSWH